jgi:hypothetical protein
MGSGHRSTPHSEDVLFRGLDVKISAWAGIHRYSDARVLQRRPDAKQRNPHGYWAWDDLSRDTTTQATRCTKNTTGKWGLAQGGFRRTKQYRQGWMGNCALCRTSLDFAGTGPLVRGEELELRASCMQGCRFAQHPAYA